jgi:hypothetical protein
MERSVFEKRTVPPIGILLCLMEPEGSLPRSQQLTSFRILSQISPLPRILFLSDTV